MQGDERPKIDPADLYRLAIERGFTVDVEAGVAYGRRGKPLKASRVKRGGAVIGIDIGDGERRVIYLRRLVAFVAWGERALAPGVKIWHDNGDTMDCRLSNLRMGTHQQAMKAAGKAGKLNSGGSVSAIFTDQDIAAIRAELFGEWKDGRLKPGAAARLAKKYGVSRTHIGKIAHFTAHTENSGLPPLPR